MAKPKPNEGDIIEGIFVLALALYIADGKIDKSKLNKLRTRIEPAKFNSGAVTVVVADDVERRHGKNPPDLFDVIAVIRLKASVTSVGFGKEYRQKYYEKHRDYGDLDAKINQIVASVSSARFTREVDAHVNRFLRNNKRERAVFEVTADGIAGESSGGNIKGDVNLAVYAESRGKRTLVRGGRVAFSLKSNSATVANLSPYEGMLAIAEHMGIRWDAAERYAALKGIARTPAEKKQKFKYIRAMYADLISEIKSAAKRADFTQRMLRFLADNIFGQDMATVVDVRENTVKEITPVMFKEMEQYAKLEVRDHSGANKGGNVVFHDRTTGEDIFQLRLRAEEARNFGKFYLEVKPGVYAKAPKK